MVATLALLPAGVAKASPKASDQSLSSHGHTVAERVFASANPHTAYDHLSRADRKAFDAVEAIASVESAITSITPLDAVASRATSTPASMQALSSYSGCWGMHVTGKAKAAAGNTLYTYWQTTNVCVSNASVYTVWLPVELAGGETSTPGWRIDKKPDLTTYNVGWEGRGNARYHFVLGAGPWDIQHPTNCLQLRLNADGHRYWASYSCDLGAAGPA